MTNHQKYQKLTNWAQRRYTKSGSLIISIGGVLTLYSRIEEAAFGKYMRRGRDANGRLVFNT